MTMLVIAAVAEFERDLLIERTQAGISRAKAAGKQFGRPPGYLMRKIVLTLTNAWPLAATFRRWLGNSKPPGKPLCGLGMRR
jgi:DNA invertase Pin-like site-specific DNA recombinase